MLKIAYCGYDYYTCCLTTPDCSLYPYLMHISGTLFIILRILYKVSHD